MWPINGTNLNIVNNYFVGTQPTTAYAAPIFGGYNYAQPQHMPSAQYPDSFSRLQEMIQRLSARFMPGSTMPNAAYPGFSESITITDNKHPHKHKHHRPDFDAVHGNTVEAGVNINGSHNELLVKDNGGKDNNRVGGHHNRVEFIGDEGANDFHVGGKHNEVSIYNVGADDDVHLKGKRKNWHLVNVPEDGKSRDSSHHITYHNKKTDTYVKIASDESNRGKDWLKDRVVFG